jgi:hypothetical protein
VEHCQVYLNIDLLESVPRSGRQRQEIMKFVYSLPDRPRTKGDYTDKDASLQTRQIKIIGDYAITYWPDDAVKSVMVVDVRPADRCRSTTFGNRDSSADISVIRTIRGRLFFRKLVSISVDSWLDPVFPRRAFGKRDRCAKGPRADRA